MSLLRAIILISWYFCTTTADCNPNEILVSETGEAFVTENCSTNGCGEYNFFRLLLSHIDNPNQWVDNYIGYIEDATEEFDWNYDAMYKRPPYATEPNYEGVMLASVIEKHSDEYPISFLMAINRLPNSVLSETYTIPLYHFAGKTEHYTIAMTEMENFPGDYTIILHDNKATEEWETASHILNTGPYTFLGDPDDNSNAWEGDAGLHGSDRFSIDVIPTIEGYASCQFNCGAAVNKKKCKKKTFKDVGCKWVTVDDDWPELTNLDGECINPAFIEVTCSEAGKKKKCLKTFPYSSKCKWVPTATNHKGECLDLDDEEYTPLTCDLALKKNGTPSKKKCLSKHFQKIDCEWETNPKKCVEKE